MARGNYNYTTQYILNQVFDTSSLLLYTSAAITSIVPGTGATSLGKAEDAAHSSGDTGVQVLSVRKDTLSANTGTSGDYASLLTDGNGSLYVTQKCQATTLFDADGDNTAQVCKSSAGVLHGLSISNPNVADAFIQLFNTAAGSVVVGTTTPKLSFLVPGESALEKDFAVPINFSTAITYACTTTATGNTDPATGLVVNMIYK